MEINKKISIVLPTYNEEKNVLPIYEALIRVFSDHLKDYRYEIIFTNDGSSDGTSEEIRKIAEKDTNVKLIFLSRNFGHQAALVAGLRRATGDSVISMDCDFQDPPELLPDLVHHWEAGYKVVFTRRKTRSDHFLKKWSADLYYRLLSLVANISIPRQVADFRLLDRQVVNQLNDLARYTRFLRGTVAWLGFKHTFVDFDRKKRVRGKSHYTLKK